MAEAVILNISFKINLCDESEIIQVTIPFQYLVVAHMLCDCVQKHIDANSMYGYRSNHVTTCLYSSSIAKQMHIIDIYLCFADLQKAC